MFLITTSASKSHSHSLNHPYSSRRALLMRIFGRKYQMVRSSFKIIIIIRKNKKRRWIHQKAGPLAMPRTKVIKMSHCRAKV